MGGYAPPVPIRESLKDAVPAIDGPPEPGSRAIWTAVSFITPGDFCVICEAPATRDLGVPLVELPFCTPDAIKRLSVRLSILMPWTRPKPPRDGRST